MTHGSGQPCIGKHIHNYNCNFAFGLCLIPKGSYLYILLVHDFDNLNNKEIEKKVANYSLEEVKAFKIFNIPPTKNTEIIKKTYKKLVKKYHPDFF